MRRETCDRSIKQVRRASQDRKPKESFDISRVRQIAFCPCLTSRAERVEFESGESTGAVIHDGNVRAGVEQERGRLAVQLPVEQDQSVDDMEGD